MGRWTVLITLCVACLLGATVPAAGAQLMSVEDALKSVFGDDAEFRSDVKTLKASQLLQLETELGKQLMADEEKSAWGCPIDPEFTFDPSAGEAEPETPFEFFFATEDGEDIGAAVVVETPGKWDMVQYLVGMDMGGAVTRVEMITSSEKRGRDVARRSFMKQFTGKTADDNIDVEDGIMAVSGATVTSKSACSAVTMAVILYKEFYLEDGGSSVEPAAVAEEAASAEEETAPTASDASTEDQTPPVSESDQDAGATSP